MYRYFHFILGYSILMSSMTIFYMHFSAPCSTFFLISPRENRKNQIFTISSVFHLHLQTLMLQVFFTSFSLVSDVKIPSRLIQGKSITNLDFDFTPSSTHGTSLSQLSPLPDESPSFLSLLSFPFSM